MESCSGNCNTCTVDHSLDQISNRGHGISYSSLAIQYAQDGKYLNRDDNLNLILQEDNVSVFEGAFGGPACGDIVNLWVKLDTNHNTILDAKFLSTGCYGSLSSTSYGCEQIIGKNLFDINTQELTKNIMETLDLPKIKAHCSVFIGQCLEEIREKVNKIIKF